MGILATLAARGRKSISRINTKRAFAIGGMTLAIGIAGTSSALGQDLSPVTSMLTTIGTTLTGPLGRAIGLIALAAVGILFMLGRMNWMFAASVFVGLVLLFGSATILAGF